MLSDATGRAQALSSAKLLAALKQVPSHNNDTRNKHAYAGEAKKNHTSKSPIGTPIMIIINMLMPVS
jgi:hypothetical protein